MTSSDPISAINEAMENAVAAQEGGDYASALKHMETAYMRIAMLPNSEFNNERLEWRGDQILALMNYLKGRISAGAGSTPRTSLISQNPILYTRG